MSGIIKKKPAKKSGKARPAKPIRQIARGVHFFKRTFSSNETITDTFTHKALSLSLSQVPNYTEFTNLFDEYKICAVKMKFIYSHNSSDVENANNRALPIMMLVRDYDDDTVLTSYNDYNQYDTLRVRALDKPITVYTRPKCSSALFTGTVFSGYGSMKSQWIDSNSPTVKHYAIKWGIDPVIAGTGTNNIGRMMVYTTVYFKCRGVM